MLNTRFLKKLKEELAELELEDFEEDLGEMDSEGPYIAS